MNNTDVISDLLSSFNPKSPNFRPSEIYNENWLIKLVLHHTSTIADEDSLLSFLPMSTWYSEGLLPTAFKARVQGDPLSESRTNADGVIGHMRIGHKAKADLELVDGAKQFTVVEAKVGAPLSSGVRNAKYFNQASRSVACMAQVMAEAGISPESIDRLGFLVLAPEAAIRKDIFSEHMKRGSIRSNVERRISEYEGNVRGELRTWSKDYFEPTMKHIEIHCLSWEEILGWMSIYKPEVTEKLNEYYELCLRYK